MSFETRVIRRIPLDVPQKGDFSLDGAPAYDAEADRFVIGAQPDDGHFQKEFSENAYFAVFPGLSIALFDARSLASQTAIKILPDIRTGRECGSETLQVSTAENQILCLSNNYHDCKLNVIDADGNPILFEEEPLSGCAWLQDFAFQPEKRELLTIQQSDGGGGAFGVTLMCSRLDTCMNKVYSIDDADVRLATCKGKLAREKCFKSSAFYGFDMYFPLAFDGDAIFLGRSVDILCIIGSSSSGDPQVFTPLLDASGEPLSLLFSPNDPPVDEVDRKSPEIYQQADSQPRPNMNVGWLFAENSKMTYDACVVLLTATKHWIHVFHETREK